MPLTPVPHGDPARTDAAFGALLGGSYVLGGVAHTPDDVMLPTAADGRTKLAPVFVAADLVPRVGERPAGGMADVCRMRLQPLGQAYRPLVPVVCWVVTLLVARQEASPRNASTARA
jgi:hypothetical protein